MNSRGSNAVIGPAAERPPIRRSQLVATSLANGVTAPSPVITTLRRPLAPINPSDPQSAVDEEHLARDDHEATSTTRSWLRTLATLPLATAQRIGNRQVFLAGWRLHEELPQALNAADALVLPSVAEAFGLVLVEAMACGLPVIACRTPGPAAIVVDGGTGWLIRPDDEEALVDALVSAARGEAKGEGGPAGRRVCRLPGKGVQTSANRPSSRSARLDPSARRWCEQAVTLPPTRLRKQGRSGRSPCSGGKRRLLVEGAPLGNQSNAC
jgi:hypothetical protein